MRNVIIERCLDIVRKVVATQNVGGMGYIEEALRLEKEKNNFRRMSIENGKNKNNSQ